MEEYIARHKDEFPLKELEDPKNTGAYGCSDPRLHPRAQEQSEHAAEEAERRIEDDFKTLSEVLTYYWEEHGVLPYCIVLQCLASRYLGGGMFHPTYYDETHPYLSSPQFSLVFWNLGNWCRKQFSKCPLPEKLQKMHLILIIKWSVSMRSSVTNLNTTTISSTLSRILEHICL